MVLVIAVITANFQLLSSMYLMTLEVAFIDLWDQPKILYKWSFCASAAAVNHRLLFQ